MSSDTACPQCGEALEIEENELEGYRWICYTSSCAGFTLTEPEVKDLEEIYLHDLDHAPIPDPEHDFPTVLTRPRGSYKMPGRRSTIWR